MVDQFHHKVKLTMVVPGRKQLDHIRVIHCRGDAGLLFQSRAFHRIQAQLPSQDFQRDQPVQPRVPRFVDRAHTANTQRFEELKMIEGVIDPEFRPAPGTVDSRQRFGGRHVHRLSAARTILRRRVALGAGHPGASYHSRAAEGSTLP